MLYHCVLLCTIWSNTFSHKKLLIWWWWFWLCLRTPKAPGVDCHAILFLKFGSSNSNTYLMFVWTCSCALVQYAIWMCIRSNLFNFQRNRSKCSLLANTIRYSIRRYLIETLTWFPVRAYSCQYPCGRGSVVKRYIHSYDSNIDTKPFQPGSFNIQEFMLSCLSRDTFQSLGFAGDKSVLY